MADDIIRSVVGAADRDEAIEEMFFALHPRLARTAFGLVGDWDLAEQLAQEAFLRLWRRWPWLRDRKRLPPTCSGRYGSQATGVLRVSMATGRPQGSVSGAGSCGQPCWQIYLAGGSVWVPTQTHVTRIDQVSHRLRRTASR